MKTTALDIAVGIVLGQILFHCGAQFFELVMRVSDHLNIGRQVDIGVILTTFLIGALVGTIMYYVIKKG